MTVGVASERAVVAAAQRTWGEAGREERLLVVRASPEWTGPDVVMVAETPCRVVACVSTLAVRDAMSSLGADERLVVLTDVDDESLGIDVLAHAVRQRSTALDSWDGVRAVFGVRQAEGIDPALVRRGGELLAAALVEHAPPGGWPRPAAGVVTLDHAFESLSAVLLGLEADRLDLAGLLEWSRDAASTLAFRDLPSRLRTVTRVWLLGRVGADAAPVLDLAERGFGTDALALGVAAGVLWGPGTSMRAQGRFEQSFLDRDLGHSEQVAWSEASRGWVERSLAGGSDALAALAVLARAEQVVLEVGAERLVESSDLLPAGLEARLGSLGDALVAFARGRGAARLATLENQLTSLETHRLAVAATERVDTARQGVRLARWSAEGVPAMDTSLDALEWHVREGGWVDRARQRAWVGDANPRLALGLRAVFEDASTSRRAIDRQAASLVATSVGEDAAFGRLVPVEAAVRDLVLPLTEGAPVLLLVLDGMSAAVACEIAESTASAGWSEIVQTGGAQLRRSAVIAGLPTVTEVSRTSLFAGRRQRGGQAEERSGFRALAGERSELFHLAELAGGAGNDLPQHVREAVNDVERPIVAAVLNTVDDALNGGDPGRTRWTVDAVRHLRPLLDRAAVAGRTVVLLSDHGHVIDQPDAGEVRRAGVGGARWRSADSLAGDDEVLLEGPRVLLGDGRVVAAVDETLRYRQRAEGYHGGAALAELTIPVLVMVRRGSEVPDGWTVAPPQQPAWWASGVLEDAPLGGVPGTLFEDAPSRTEAILRELARRGSLVRAAADVQHASFEQCVSFLVEAGGSVRLSAVAAAGGLSMVEAAAALRRLADDIDPDRSGVLVVNEAVDTVLLAMDRVYA